MFTKNTEKLVPENISDLGRTDDDSGLRVFRGMMSPWDKIVSFRETYHYAARMNALMAASFYDVLRIVEPDYRKRTQLVGELWGSELEKLWKDPNLKMREQFLERWQVPEGEHEGVHLAGLYADKGDEMMLMSGRVHDFGPDRVEKELDNCHWDIVGPEICDASMQGGHSFMRGAAGIESTTHCYERRGCGNLHCRVVEERGDTRNAGERWEQWGPAVSGRGKSTPREEMKSEPEFLTTGVYRAATGATWTAGEMFRDYSIWPMFGTAEAIRALRQLVDNPETLTHLTTCVFRSAGKWQFGDPAAIKGVRDWLGVPGEIKDSRVMGGYISMLLQAKVLPWKFTEFEPDRTVIETDRAALGVFGQFPEVIPAYQALFDGMVKTLVGAEWVVGFDEEAPQDVARLVIERDFYGVKNSTNETVTS